MERKVIKFDVKAIDEEQGIIEGYGATFSQIPDAYGDIIDPGAFTKTLKENADSVVSLFNHNVNEPIGRPELAQDKTGLLARIKLVLEVEKARDVLALARAGVIKKMSIGYDTIKSDFINGIRHLKEVRLYDVSPVIFAANPEARILSVKEMELKPYPNEHACRLKDPDDFQDDSFRRTTRTSDGKKYSVIMGRLSGEETLTEQAYRYDKEVWDADDAKTHCKEHDGAFEAATEKEGKSGRVLSAASVSKLKAALEALQALLESSAEEEEPKKSARLTDAEGVGAELDAIIEGLRNESSAKETKEAEARIDRILMQLKEEK